jgi:protein SCO1
MKSKILGMLVFVVGLYGAGCKEDHSSHDHSHHDAEHDHSHHGKDHLLPAGDAAPGSIYAMDSVWTTQEGKKIQFKQYKGKLFLISMFYASCKSVCPRIVSDMERIGKKIQDVSGQTPHMILVSFDPENDTTKSLKEYKGNLNLGDNWVLLNGSDDDVRTLSIVLGINYKKTSDGDFNHSAIVSLISKEGFVVSRVEGVGANADKLIQKFNELR